MAQIVPDGSHVDLDSLHLFDPGTGDSLRD